MRKNMDHTKEKKKSRNNENKDFQAERDNRHNKALLTKYACFCSFLSEIGESTKLNRYQKDLPDIWRRHMPVKCCVVRRFMETVERVWFILYGCSSLYQAFAYLRITRKASSDLDQCQLRRLSSTEVNNISKFKVKQID
ncbi:hypothetical protein TNCV_3978521 [Trichonephila clavipes]|uniref:Uncharacterized protein n=1 Tax=Trichonephila clavipes TaxID=2585209 RepID=A0A8X6WH23_TRICX|nr:hypothetical protein TNCV_3978521 [Trichonephila clavipes]